MPLSQLHSIRFHGFGDGIKVTGSLTEERAEPPKPLAFLDAALAEEEAQDEAYLRTAHTLQ